MTDEENQVKFKAPSLPSHPIQMPTASVGTGSPAPTSVPSAAVGVQAEGAPAPVSVSQPAQASSGLYDNNFAADLKLSPKVLQTKFFLAIVLGVLFFGLFMGCALSSGDKKPVQSSGLGGIVGNSSPFVRQARRCGTTDVNNACVLYIMNAKPYERKGGDFFEEAANTVNAQPYLVRINNVEYQNQLIPPGWIAEIYIPSRR